MTKFESSTKAIAYPIEAVYAMLSDLNNLERVKNKLPEDKIKNLQFDQDHCSITMDMIGEVKLSVVEREENKTIKFFSDNSPIDFNLWIQLVPSDESNCYMRLTIKADLNPFIKGMVSKPLEDGIEKVADVIAAIPFA